MGMQYYTYIQTNAEKYLIGPANIDLCRKWMQFGVVFLYSNFVVVIHDGELDDYYDSGETKINVMIAEQKYYFKKNFKLKKDELVEIDPYEQHDEMVIKFYEFQEQLKRSEEKRTEREKEWAAWAALPEEEKEKERKKTMLMFGIEDPQP